MTAKIIDGKTFAARLRGAVGAWSRALTAACRRHSLAEPEDLGG